MQSLASTVMEQDVFNFFIEGTTEKVEKVDFYIKHLSTLWVKDFCYILSCYFVKHILTAVEGRKSRKQSIHRLNWEAYSKRFKWVTA